MKYIIGVDFGTLSCRAVLVTQNGDLVKTAVMEYPHGCIDAPHSGVLQEPQDYLDCLKYTVRQVAGEHREDIVSLGIDFTACTALPAPMIIRLTKILLSIPYPATIIHCSLPA